MGDFDNIKDKLLNYQSPIDIEEMWEELALKQENVTLKKELRIRNIIGGVLGVGLLIVGGAWLVMSIITNLNHNTLENIHSNNNINTPTETNTNEKNDLEKTVHMDEVSKKEELIDTNEMQTLAEVSTMEKTTTPEDISSTKKTSNSAKINMNVKPSHQTLSTNTPINSFETINNSSDSNFNSTDKQKIMPENTQFLPLKIDTTENKAEDMPPIVSASMPQLTPLIQTNKQGATAATIQTLAAKSFLIDQQTNTNLLQTTSPVPPKYKLRGGKNFVGLELLGQGGFYSLNYGRVLGRQRFGETDIQLGVSRNPRYVTGLPNIHILMGSISIHQSFRIYRPHHLTIGLAAVFGHRTTDADTASNSYYNLGAIVPKIGYRYHAPGSRISYKAELIAHSNFSYVSIGENMEIPPRIYPNKGNVWGGVGIAYHF